MDVRFGVDEQQAVVRDLLPGLIAERLGGDHDEQLRAGDPQGARAKLNGWLLDSSVRP